MFVVADKKSICSKGGIIDSGFEVTREMIGKNFDALIENGTIIEKIEGKNEEKPEDKEEDKENEKAEIKEEKKDEPKKITLGAKRNEH